MTFSLTYNTLQKNPGDQAGGATPVPIPNTEVKSSRADDTAAARLWESRTLPGSFKPIDHKVDGLFLFLVLYNYGSLFQFPFAHSFN
jgi:hypothetical protein